VGRTAGAGARATRPLPSSPPPPAPACTAARASPVARARRRLQGNAVSVCQCSGGMADEDAAPRLGAIMVAELASGKPQMVQLHRPLRMTTHVCAVNDRTAPATKRCRRGCVVLSVSQPMVCTSRSGSRGRFAAGSCAVPIALLPLICVCQWVEQQELGGKLQSEAKCSRRRHGASGVFGESNLSPRCN